MLNARGPGIIHCEALSTYYRVVGTLNGALTQIQVAKHLKIGPKALKHWVVHDGRGETMKNLKG